jgi:hypothetical protein
MAPVGAICGLLAAPRCDAAARAERTLRPASARGVRALAARPACPAGASRRGVARGARADLFGGITRFFSDKPQHGEDVEEDDDEEAAPAKPVVSSSTTSYSATTVSSSSSSVAASGSVEVSALEASLGLGPYTSGQTAAIAAFMERAERDAAAKARAVDGARAAATGSKDKLAAAIEASTAKAQAASSRMLDENQARAEALVRAPIPLLAPESVTVSVGTSRAPPRPRRAPPAAPSPRCDARPAPTRREGRGARSCDAERAAAAAVPTPRAPHGSWAFPDRR